MSNVCKILMMLFQLTSFFLVVSLMLPYSQYQQKKRAEFVKFLFNGFVKPDQLTDAILA